MILKSLLRAWQTAASLMLPSLCTAVLIPMTFATEATSQTSLIATATMARTIPARKTVSEGEIKDGRRTGAMGTDEQAV